jgi:phenylpropionate dioxygenase-like ring-hydroxylating dioxygenase large terminal subunit
MTAGPAAMGNTHPALRFCWHPVARSAQVGEQPLRVKLLGEAYVIFRSGGKVRAFIDRCPHRGAPLSIGAGEEGGLRCAYHGWLFDCEGACTEIPALGNEATLPQRARLGSVGGVAERLGMVFLAPESPAPGVGLPSIEEADKPGFLMGELPIMRARASVGLLADNFLDTAHFPYIHAATFGATEDKVVGRFEVERQPGELGFTACYEHTFSNREDPGVASGERPLLQTRRLTYRLDAPFHLSLSIDYLEAGGRNTLGFYLQPEDAEHCRVYSALWRNDLDGDLDRLAEAVSFEVKVVEEDLALQEQFDVLSIPLDLTAEMHTKADRTTLELRRVLCDLVEVTS